jgi:hypothetical protein
MANKVEKHKKQSEKQVKAIDITPLQSKITLPPQKSSNF